MLTNIELVSNKSAVFVLTNLGKKHYNKWCATNGESNDRLAHITSICANSYYCYTLLEKLLMITM